MTDRQTLTAMLDRAGVAWHDVEIAATDGSSHIQVEAHDGPSNKGYVGFFADFAFDAEGTLSAVGVWE